LTKGKKIGEKREERCERSLEEQKTFPEKKRMEWGATHGLIAPGRTALKEQLRRGFERRG